MHKSPPRLRAGFTLIEAAMALVIVGVGIVALMALFGASTRENGLSAQMTTAMLLAGNVREAMVGLAFNDPAYGRANFGPEVGETLATYDDVDDFDGQSFNPPIDGLRAAQPQLSQFTQAVMVRPVYPAQLNVNTNDASPSISRTTYTGAVRVSVRVFHRAAADQPAAEVYRASWVLLDR